MQLQVFDLHVTITPMTKLPEYAIQRKMKIVTVHPGKVFTTNILKTGDFHNSLFLNHKYTIFD